MKIIPINVWTDHFLLKAAGGVNCYLIQTDTGFVLIDTGMHDRRTELVRALEEAGLQPGKLDLIVITHADLDHIGNCAYLHKHYGGKVAAHLGEARALQTGNMSLNRKHRQSPLARAMLGLMSLFGRQDRLSPQVYLADGDDLSAFGLAAQALHLPGHSQGSLGVLTAAGDLFCGDMFINISHPVPQPDNIDDPLELAASIARLKDYPVETIYPGHGKSFRLDEIQEQTV